jgi:hypothetical protein
VDSDSEFLELEKFLRSNRPAALPQGLQERMEDVAADVPTLADRVLAFWAGAGTVAACAVVAMTVWEVATGPEIQRVSPREMAQQQQMIQEYRRILALR